MYYKKMSVKQLQNLFRHDTTDLYKFYLECSQSIFEMDIGYSMVGAMHFMQEWIEDNLGIDINEHQQTSDKTTEKHTQS